MRGSHEASAEAELALLLAGTEHRRRRARGRILDLAVSADPTPLVRYLSERRLLALVGSRLLDLLPEPPSELADAVTAEVGRLRLHALATDGVTTRLARRLEERGIATLPLKGPRLAQELYGDPGLRASADVDLLVPADRLDEAVEVAREEGYGAPRERPRGGDLPDLHFELPHPQLPPVELHWRVHWYDDGLSQAALARSAPADDGLRRAQPTDAIAMLLLFYARDGFHGLRQAADIGAWCDDHGASGPSTGLLDDHAASYPDLAPALRAAAVCTERHAGVPAAALLSDAGQLDRRGRLAVGLADWATEDDRDQLAANIALVDGLLAPRGRSVEFVGRQLLRPASSLTAAAEPAPGSVASRRLEALHAIKTLARFGLALWRVRGGRPWRPLPPAVAGNEKAPAPAG